MSHGPEFLIIQSNLMEDIQSNKIFLGKMIRCHIFCNKMLVIAHFHCQLDVIFKSPWRQSSASLYVSLRVLSERLNSGRKALPECRWHHLMGQDPELNDKENPN